MLQSMTGYGEAQLEAEGMSFLVEIKSLNHRFLKSVIKLPDLLSFAEPMITKLIQERLSRGSVTCTVHMRYTGEQGAQELNIPAARSYLTQLEPLAKDWKTAFTGVIDTATLLQMPGICQPRQYSEEEHKHLLDILVRLTNQAIEKLIVMRREEGKSLLADLESQCVVIRRNLETIQSLADRVVIKYRDRIQQRVNSLLAEAKLQLDEETLHKEVALFAERCDINEEVSRLSSHLDQFRDICLNSDQVGRRLDFLTQELLREANTISSKANDALISQHVVEIKVAIDRLKEQVQNAE